MKSLLKENQIMTEWKEDIIKVSISFSFHPLKHPCVLVIRMLVKVPCGTHG